jgi:protein involved in polysaccharide export with SLBB domain
LAAVGNLQEVDSTAQENWAFRTWTALQNRLSISPNHGLVCGFTSAQAGEGRSTWIALLAQAAGQCGFRVLTIGTLSPEQSDNGNSKAGGKSLNGHSEMKANETALTSHVLSSPSLVTEQLIGNDPQPCVHIPLPGWVWNLERRKEWQTALNQWSRIENIVILVELPPACVPETILLAENLPNLIWLTRSGAVKASESRTHLQSLRNARCRLVGAVLNRESAPPITNRFQRWIGCAAVCFALGLGIGRTAEPLAPAEGPPAAVPPAAVNEIPATNQNFSVNAPAKRAAWQQRFTLGPGDVVNFSLFGQPELNLNDVFIGPDGRISFLQAHNILAAGLTVDELRAKFDEELGKYYRMPRTMITPVSFHSKKYFVLGKVVNRGVFPLDRPLTIVEALARAKGLETGLLPDNRSMMDLADLQRSFLMRQGKRVPINLEKLFQEGDLSQNVALEPDDYLYFASANLKQVYVLGEVGLPGPLPYTGNMTAVGAIAARGGFTQRAYKGRVLVIRGSINRPQTFVVDVWKAMEAQGMDFKLEPKDIVYVNYRPFIKAEELVDLGITAFLQSVTVEWTGLHIDPRTE